MYNARIMRLRLVAAPVLVLLAFQQQGPFRLLVTPHNSSMLPSSATAQVRANVGGFRAIGQPGGNRDVTTSVQWKSSDTSVASVDNAGVVTPTNKGGATVISARLGPFHDSGTLNFIFTCGTETYDVNNNNADGCEVTDPVFGNHTQALAKPLAQTTCDDVASANTINGLLPSDSRIHFPSPSFFDFNTGSAPDWFSQLDNGGLLCTNDYNISFSVGGGGATPCYTLTFITDKINVSTPAICGGCGTGLTGGAGSYSSGSTVYFEVQKTCALPVQEDVGYTITYHL